MRTIGWLVASCVLVIMSVTLVEGQQDDKKKAGGFQFGGLFGGGQKMDPLTILRNGAVKKELEVSDEQMEKLPAEVMKAISNVLTEKQMKRFRQIELQQQGNNGFKDENVQTALKITAEQKKSIGSILDDSAKEIAEIRKAAGFGGFGKGGKGTNEKVDNINKETKEKIYGVLTADQRKGWRAMVGEELKLDSPFNFGGGFGGFGKDKKVADKKKDTE